MTGPTRWRQSSLGGDSFHPESMRTPTTLESRFGPRNAGQSPVTHTSGGPSLAAGSATAGGTTSASPKHVVAQSPRPGPWPIPKRLLSPIGTFPERLNGRKVVRPRRGRGLRATRMIEAIHYRCTGHTWAGSLAEMHGPIDLSITMYRTYLAGCLHLVDGRH